MAEKKFCTYFQYMSFIQYILPLTKGKTEITMAFLKGIIKIKNPVEVLN